MGWGGGKKVSDCDVQKLKSEEVVTKAQEHGFVDSQWRSADKGGAMVVLVRKARLLHHTLVVSGR